MLALRARQARLAPLVSRVPWELRVIPDPQVRRVK